MYESHRFEDLVGSGNPTGEVVGVDRFLVRMKGFAGVPAGAMVLFENGQRGLVRQVEAETVVVFNLSSERLTLGALGVLEQAVLSVGVGEVFIGRVVSALGEPLDGKGPIVAKQRGAVFGVAPGIHERRLLEDQLVTGVPIVDTLFTLALGQRIAILGDSKTGKSAFATQVALSQKGQNRTVIYVLIAKRKADVDAVVSKLTAGGALDYTVVVVASVFDPLTQAYLAPYSACAMGEYLWQQGRDVIMIYDDLSSHAKVYREMSLLARTSPGRESYPGDMFYAHSSLLERAGRLHSNGATMAALGLVLTPADDITAALPTGVMSMTDGQLIFDLATFRQGIRPAVNVGLSVSRVGGMVQSSRLKTISRQLTKKLADYRQALQFSHFGTDLGEQVKADLNLGKLIYEAYRQTPDETITITEQILIFMTILKNQGRNYLSVEVLKRQAREVAPRVTKDADYDQLSDQLLQSNGSVQPTAGKTA